MPKAPHSRLKTLLKRKPGRPSVPREERMIVQVSCMLRQREYEQVKHDAAQHGLSMSSYLRKLKLGFTD